MEAIHQRYKQKEEAKKAINDKKKDGAEALEQIDEDDIDSDT